MFVVTGFNLVQVLMAWRVKGGGGQISLLLTELQVLVGEALNCLGLVTQSVCSNEI